MKPSREQLEAIFEAAAALQTDAQRQEYLDRACPDSDLRKEVESLLAAMKHPESLFDTQDETATEKLDSLPVLEQPGTMIGRYKLLQKVGVGGMGVVYMAEQTEPVKRKVALKIIKLGMDTKQVVARFEAERQALAMMDHPNIAKVLDAGATDTGRPYFVMELVRGVPITEYCDKNKLTTEERLNLFMDVCRAIHHAHQKGVIHRDIKPSNVMVTLHDGHPVAKVIDFGIAKATHSNLTEKTLFTNYSQIIGTPAYMSPEQAEMSGLDVDTRTDVYSLGVLLYELLTGTTPFTSKKLLSLGFGEMQRVIAEEEPPKPSTRVSTMLNEQRTVIAKNRAVSEGKFSDALKGDLDWIVMKSLEKDRTKRYETVNALVQDVQGYLNEEPVSAAAPTLSYQLKKLYKRNRGFAQAAMIIATLLVLSTVISGYLAHRANQMKRLVEEEKNESDKLRKSEAAAHEDAQVQLRHALMRQANALVQSGSPGFETNVWDAVNRAKKLPGAENDLVELRNLAWAGMAAPVQKQWENLDNPIPNGENLTQIAISYDAVAFGYQDGSILVFDLKTGFRTRTLSLGSNEPIISLEHHAFMDLWVAANAAGEIGVWPMHSDLKEPESLFSLTLSKLGPGPDSAQEGQEYAPLELLPTKKGLAVYEYATSSLWLWENLKQQDFIKDQLPFYVAPNKGGSIMSNPPIGIHPDGVLIAAVTSNRETGFDEGFTIWDAESRNRSASFYDYITPDLEISQGVKFSEHGNDLVLGFGGHAVVFSINTGVWDKRAIHVGYHFGVGTYCEISPDGTRVFSSGLGRQFRLHDNDAKEPVFNFLEAMFGGVGLCKFNKQGDHFHFFRIGRSDGPWSVMGFGLERTKELTTIKTEGMTTGMNFASGTENVFVSTTQGMSEYSVEGIAVQKYSFANKPKTYVEDPDISPDGQFIAAWSMISDQKDMGFGVWRVNHEHSIKSVPFGGKYVNRDGWNGSVDFAPDKPQLAVVSGNQIGIWSYSSDPDLKDDFHMNQIYNESLDKPGIWVSFSSSGDHLLWIERDVETHLEHLFVLNTDTLEKLPFNKVGQHLNYSVTILPDPHRIALISEEEGELYVQIWDFVENRKLTDDNPDLRVAKLGSSHALSADPTGRYLAFTTQNIYSLSLYDLRRKQIVTTSPRDERSPLLGSAWSPDGKYLCSLGLSPNLRVWNIEAVRQRLAEMELNWED